MLVWFGYDDQRCSEVLYLEFQVIDRTAVKVVFTSVCVHEEGFLGEMRLLCIFPH